MCPEKRNKQLFRAKYLFIGFVTFIIGLVMLSFILSLPPAEHFKYKIAEFNNNEHLNNVHFVFLNGLRCFYNESVYANMGFTTIRRSLSQLGYSFYDQRFLLYSYRGGEVKDGKWYPEKYQAQDTGQPICLSIEKLEKLFEEYSIAYPEAKFILVGHSLGGRIALDFVSTTSPQNKERIMGVITLNSPLLGAGRVIPNYILKLIGYYDNIYTTPAVRELIWEAQYQQELASLRRQTVKQLQANGMRVATFSTYQDFFVHPQTGCVMDENKNPVSEGFIMNLGWFNRQDIFGHMVILENSEIVNYIISICLTPATYKELNS